jgi:KipI family sensor histidine kinase inhibitor
VLIRYDPSAIHTDALEKWLHDSGSEFPAAVQEHRSFVLPAVFDGPDLQELAESAGLSPARVVDLFCSREYRVYSLGFVPGFAYMGAVPSRIAKPRRAVPRTTVPAGSVGIAGEQTGIYPSATPGGWNLIGRCFVRLFDPNRDPACLLRTGDSVRFQPA